MGIDPDTFRRALGHFASGVTVVTATNGDVRHGITVSSFCSLSLEPPLVLICIDRTTGSHELIKAAGTFAVNILAEESQDLSQLFASRSPDKFASVAFHAGQTGAPLLDEALATIECRLYDQLPGGDHSIFVGEVIATEIRDERAPLLYYRSRYHQLS